MGQTDLYTFPVSDGTVYKVVGQGGCKVENGDEFALDIDGVSEEWVDGSAYFDEQSVDGDCNETYLFRATETGTARMEVSGEDFSSTGTYSFLVEEDDSTEFTPPTSATSEVAEETSEPTTTPETTADDAPADSNLDSFTLTATTQI